MRKTSSSTLVLASGACAMALMSSSVSGQTLREQVWADELAFAKSMADRDIQRFGEFVSAEAVFFSGTQVLTGKTQVLEAWATFFAQPNPPFSWKPDQVEVLESGSLAISTGPVFDPTGKVIARFNSIWRLEPGNTWRVVFDKGSPPSPGPP